MKHSRKLFLVVALTMVLTIFSVALSTPQEAKAFTWGTKPAQIYFTAPNKSIAWINVTGTNQNNQKVTWYGNGNGSGSAKTTNWWWKLENGVTIKFWLNGIGEKSCSFTTSANAWQFDYNWYWITYDPAKYGNQYPCQYGGPGWY